MYKHEKVNEAQRLEKYLLKHDKVYEQADTLAWNKLFQERIVKCALIRGVSWTINKQKCKHWAIKSCTAFLTQTKYFSFRAALLEYNQPIPNAFQAMP